MLVLEVGCDELQKDCVSLDGLDLMSWHIEVFDDDCISYEPCTASIIILNVLICIDSMFSMSIFEAKHQAGIAYS